MTQEKTTKYAISTRLIITEHYIIFIAHNIMYNYTIAE